MLSEIVKEQLADAFARLVMAKIQPIRRVDIPRLLDVLGIPDSIDDPELTKAQYIESRLALVTPGALSDCVEKFLRRHAHRHYTKASAVQESNTRAALTVLAGGVKRFHHTE